jgi:KaiC/GvpD/RAD55 family RecA-like ATPase
MKRVRTGIKGFDELIQGGIPQGFSLLICGIPGTGKSIMGLEYLYRGAKDFGENGLYVSIEETAEKLRDQASMFGFDYPAMEREGKISFLKLPIDIHSYDLVRTIKAAVMKTKAKRLVIDSLSILDINAGMYSIPVRILPEKDRFYANDMMQLRDTKGDIGKQFVYLFINRIAEMGTTNIFITDSLEESTHGYLTRDTVSEFVCDGVVKLSLKEFGNKVMRTLEVKKMRNTMMKSGLQTMNMTKTGIEVTEFSF